jgi:hypothetical protein
LNLPLPPGLPAVTVALSTDALARDNEVTLVEPRPQIVSISNRLPEGRGKEALDRALGALSAVTRSERPQIIFGPGTELEQAAETGVWRVGFGFTASRMQSGEPADLIGPFVAEKRHPLLAGVTLGGVVWAGAMPLESRRSPSCGLFRKSSFDWLIGPQIDDGILFNLDLQKTNLVRAPDWPILISNIVELRRQNLAGPERWNYRAGEWIRIRLGREPKGKLHFRCGNVERDLPSARLMEFTSPEPCGLLDVMEDNDVLFRLGVNFLDEVESDLSDRTGGERGKPNTLAAGLRAESGAESDPLFWILLIAASAALVGNWCLPAQTRGRA